MIVSFFIVGNILSLKEYRISLLYKFLLCNVKKKLCNHLWHLFDSQKILFFQTLILITKKRDRIIR
ncbi:MAG: hypothetical protein D3913_10500 [Candidatus Electrothrix sp. LOE1_4_5]|nr:hypothetical protein [Candidatus Electrothrix gigas]